MAANQPVLSSTQWSGAMRRDSKFEKISSLTGIVFEKKVYYNLIRQIKLVAYSTFAFLESVNDELEVRFKLSDR